MGLGFKRAGFELAGGWDIDKFAIASYRKNVSAKGKQMDIADMNWKDVPQADVWTFGFPCVDISKAKTNGEGLNGKKSGLFFEIMRLLEETKSNNPDILPKVILAENVKNVRDDLPIIEAEYKKQGYKLYVALYDSQYWGLPQSRERYFLLGVRKDIKKKFAFPKQSPKVDKVFKDILETKVDKKYYLPQSYELFEKPKGNVIGWLDYKGHDILRRIYDTNQVAPTLTASRGGNRQPKIIDKKGVRRITPREYARLQGFPDTYKQIVSDTQFYKQMGNAVSVTVAEAIATAIKEWLEK